MNTTDEKILLGLTAIGLVANVAVRVSKKPVRLLGLDANNTAKFVGAFTAITSALLLIGTFKTAKS